jgi:bla regulator protein blaR1
MRTLLLAATAILAGFAALAATEIRSGVWTAEMETNGLNVTLFQGRRHAQNMMSLTVDVPGLSGLSAEAIASAGADVKFVLVRAAGVFSFDGHFSKGKGAGHFDFTPDPSFLRDMEQLGYANLRDDEIVLFAAEDLTPASLRGLKEMGYTIGRRDLDDIAVFRVTPALVREYASLGYPNLTLREIVDLRVGNADAAYIKSMRDLGFDHMSARQLADLAIQNVTPAYVREMRALFPSLTPHQFEELKIANITPARIETYRKAGYSNLTPQQLSEFGLQNVTPEYIEALRKIGYDKLTPQQLIDMRIFDITPEYIRQMQEIGVRDLHKMVELKETGAADVLLRKK